VLWFSVWTVLVLATLAAAFWLARDLWRKGKALVADLQHLADLAGQMADHADRLAAQAGTEPLTHNLLDDPAEHRRHLTTLREARGRRRAEREARHAVIHASWRAYSR
jgi:hypothetical protein